MVRTTLQIEIQSRSHEEGLEINESAPSNQDTYCPEYEIVQMKNEGANLELHVNEIKIYIRFGL